MSPVPSLQQVVWKAADQLMAQGIRPTVANVREITRRGSAGTINDALKDWWQHLSERLNNRIPRPDVPEPVIELTRQLWEMSLAHGEQAFGALREECLTETQTAKAALNVAQQALEQLGYQHAALQELSARLQESEKDLTARLAAESGQRQEAETRQQQAQSAWQEAEAQRTNLEKELALLAARYLHAEQQWLAERESLQRQSEQEVRNWQARQEEWQQTARSQESRLLQTEQHLLAAQQENRQLQQRIESLQQEITRLRLQGSAGDRKEALKARLRRP